jgi:hypothetical protein
MDHSGDGAFRQAEGARDLAVGLARANAGQYLLDVLRTLRSWITCRHLSFSGALPPSGRYYIPTPLTL